MMATGVAMAVLRVELFVACSGVASSRQNLKSSIYAFVAGGRAWPPTRTCQNIAIKQYRANLSVRYEEAASTLESSRSMIRATTMHHNVNSENRLLAEQMATPPESRTGTVARRGGRRSRHRRVSPFSMSCTAPAAGRCEDDRKKKNNNNNNNK
jgi:hypothetical protein